MNEILVSKYVSLLVCYLTNVQVLIFVNMKGACSVHVVYMYKTGVVKDDSAECTCTGLGEEDGSRPVLDGDSAFLYGEPGCRSAVVCFTLH